MKATNAYMSLKDIIGEIKANYLISISMSRAWRAKQLAKQVFDGDCIKQYS